MRFSQMCVAWKRCAGGPKIGCSTRPKVTNKCHCDKRVTIEPIGYPTFDDRVKAVPN